MKIKSDADYQQLSGLLQHIQSLPPNQNLIWVTLDKLASVHFVRFAFLENNTRLAVTPVYDGTLEAPPLPVQQHRAEFLAYVKANDSRGIEQFYSAYPTATTLNAKGLRRAGHRGYAGNDLSRARPV